VTDPQAPITPRRGQVPTYVLVLVLGAWAMSMMLTNRTPAPVRCERPLQPDADTVVMLSASWCSYCRAARRFLHAEQIKHCEYDIETDAEGQRRYAALPFKAIPVLSLGKETFVGFERARLEQALVAKGLRKPGK
jgi:glutaredoxin